MRFHYRIPAETQSSKLSISEKCFFIESKIVIFGISQGVVIQLKVSNSPTTGIKNITVTNTAIIPSIDNTRLLITNCFEQHNKYRL